MPIVSTLCACKNVEYPHRMMLILYFPLEECEVLLCTRFLAYSYCNFHFRSVIELYVPFPVGTGRYMAQCTGISPIPQKKV